MTDRFTHPFATSIVLPADGQRSYEELREQFREENRQRIHSRLREDVIVIRDANGVEVARKKTGYLTDAPEGHEHQRLDDYIRGGGAPPELSNEFKVIEGSALARELDDLTRDANALALHEGVIYPNANPEETSYADAAATYERSADSEHQRPSADTDPTAEG